MVSCPSLIMRVQTCSRFSCELPSYFFIPSMKLVFHFDDSYILWFTCLHSPRYFAVKTNDYYLALKVALDISFNNHR